MAPGLFPHLAIAIDEIFHAGHLLQPHRPAGMELLGADTDFRPKTKLEAIGEAGGSIDINASSVHPSLETTGMVIILSLIHIFFIAVS